MSHTSLILRNFETFPAGPSPTYQDRDKNVATDESDRLTS